MQAQQVKSPSEGQRGGLMARCDKRQEIVGDLPIIHHLARLGIAPLKEKRKQVVLTSLRFASLRDQPEQLASKIVPSGVRSVLAGVRRPLRQAKQVERDGP